VPSTHKRVVRERLPFLVAATVFTVAVSFFQVTWLTLGAGVFALLVFWFFRDPQRNAPAGERLFLSPADGRVVEIIETREEQFLKEQMIRVSVFLNVLNVHVNRIPCSGRIRDIAYRSGKFRMAQKHAASVENEQNAILLEDASGIKIVFVQIAGFIARRIVCWVGVSEQVRRGERFGIIRFGSRMDLYLPLSTHLKVQVGDRVKGGLTVIGEYP
jgi:phosphatidylserine decarboxylase